MATKTEKFAIIETGGKQYPVTEGSVIEVEKLDGKEGDKVTFDAVLLTSKGADADVGTPTVEGATVEGEIEAQGKQKKVLVVKYKSKSRYYKRRGHRQPYTRVLIKKIKA